MTGIESFKSKNKIMRDIKLIQTKHLRISFAWYDLWIGFFIDKNKKRIYFCPLPALLITIFY